MFGIFYTAGLAGGYISGMYEANVHNRLVKMRFMSHIAIVTGFWLMFNISYKRLTGFWDNGLRWKYPDTRLKKFDTTSVYEANTIWGRFRTHF